MIIFLIAIAIQLALITYLILDNRKLEADNLVMRETLAGFKQSFYVMKTQMSEAHEGPLPNGIK